ncbi:fibronectin type III domain-containing protein [Jidongwangia harbinensis]|uniref:fibronectin type III domain-containing protein n=1 Tax=Jidongwangia harbinensis TaxID=2878561 RepID=UPI002342F609|nr:fibronectin type III domain-containing protein [Jidongwangia harbinensis]
MRVRLLAGTGAAAVAASLALTGTPALASDASTALPAPQGLTVTRAADDATRIVMSWEPVAGATFYRIDMVQGGTETVTFVPGDTTTYTIPTTGPCVSYKVRVATENADGPGEYSPFVTARTLAPSGIMGAVPGRDGADGSIGTISWNEPTWAGEAPLTGYRMQLIRYSDSVVLLDQVTTATSHRFPNLDPARTYLVQVAPQNQYGTCAAVLGKSLIDKHKPADPAGAVATRRPNSTLVDVTWQAPTSGPAVDYYLLMYGVEKATAGSVKVKAPATSGVLNLPLGKNWVVEVKAYNVNGSGMAPLTVTDPTAPVVPAPVVTPAAPEKTPPTIKAALTRAADRNGWHNGPVSVIFTCVDAQSGVGTCSSPVTLTRDGADQVVTGTVTDRAGNVASTSVRVSVDRTAPAYQAAVDGTANAAGWYRTAPSVSFTCADGGSGVADCPAPVRVDGDGAARSATGTVTDRAGNTTAAAVTGLNVDTAAPAVRVSGLGLATYPLGAMPAAGCDTADTVSGVARAAVLTVARDNRARYTATCAGGTDLAGNTAAAVSADYTVTPSVPDLKALTLRYLAANNAGVGLGQDLCNKLDHGQIELYISKVLKEPKDKKAGLTAAQADELVYWARLLG